MCPTRKPLSNSVRMLGTSWAHADFPEQSQASFPGLIFLPLKDSSLLASHFWAVFLVGSVRVFWLLHLILF